MLKIGEGHKIVSCTVKKNEPAMTEAEKDSPENIVYMHETIGRPEQLEGSTYKVKTPLSDHALYITVNDIILNAGTRHEIRRPFEIFINSKNMSDFQWIVALTRIISAVFRKGGDCTFLVEELRSVFDPKGGYFKKGGKYMPSLVAEIGDVIEGHFKKIGILKKDERDKAQMVQYAMEVKAYKSAKASDDDGEFPKDAVLCGKCLTKAVIRVDGCNMCLSCGDAHCG